MTSIITLEQIKAARSLLNWTQQDLASAASISKPALANFERGIVKPRSETINSLQKALEEAGIEFIEGPGVKMRKNILEVKVLSGESIKILWNDIYHTLKSGEKRLVRGLDEERLAKIMGSSYDQMMKKFKKKNLKGRVLLLKNDRNFRDPSSEYRWINDSHFIDVPIYIYANKCAMIIWEPEPQVILIENKALANAYSQHFNKVWNKAIIPPKE